MANRIVFSVCVLLSAFVLIEAEVRIISEWSQGFKGIFSVPVTTATGGSWNVRLHFSKKVKNFQIWNADVVEILDNGATYILSNKHWNGYIGAGGKIEMEFLSHNFGTTPSGMAEIISNYVTNGLPTEPSTTERSVDAECTFEVFKQWPGQFKARIRINVKKAHSNGWTVLLIFSKPVSNMQIWNAYVLRNKAGGKKYILKNQSYNRKLMANSELHLEFIGSVDGNPPTGKARIRGEKMSQGGLCDTTASSATVGSTTSQSSLTTSLPSSTTSKTTTAAGDAPYDYGEVIRLSILFYEAQRSGKLPADNRVPWRKDSALGDKGQNGEDLTGGWYDAGDYVKFGFPMAASATNLIWGLLEFKDGYKAAGQFEWAVKGVKWALDYFIKCHVDDNVFYGQVGDGDLDNSYWGRPEDMTMDRPAFKIDADHPGSDLAGETAAAMAAGSILFRDIDPNYSATLLDHSKRLYNFAFTHRGYYNNSITNAASYYKSSAYTDELCWGALWLYKATSDDKYMNMARHFLPTEVPWAFSWDDKYAGCLVLLHEFGVEETYQYLIGFLQSWYPGGTIHYTPGGLAWRAEWGSLRYTANTALVALVAAKHGVLTSKGREFATKQIGYMLGDNGRSFVVGFGVNPPVRPHHASFSCPDAPAPCNWNTFDNPAPNAHTLYGALVGGPGKDDSYTDSRQDYVKNEVACDYNAGFQGALAGLKEIHG